MRAGSVGRRPSSLAQAGPLSTTGWEGCWTCALGGLSFCICNHGDSGAATNQGSRGQAGKLCPRQNRMIERVLGWAGLRPEESAALNS